ncbi:lysis protein [Pseudomonas sp. NPDC047963]|jgi:hypothetical protein|nr:lysis system i-spanin subunit Rz [Pseudomonas sp.]|tara:strand:- start:424 stop:1023 length:600 start_codon:yes stop_codon:yes gene_type:complete
MTITDLIPSQYRFALAAVAILVGLAAAAAGGAVVQSWRMGEQLAKQGRELDAEIAKRDQVHAATLGEISRVAAAQLRTEQVKRLKLEDDLAESSKTKHKELTDAKTAAARLLDRLATTELRLSVLLDATAGSTDQSCGMPATSAAGGVVHGVTRGQLDPAHAQRIIRITSDGDEGLIALAACQAYAERASAAHSAGDGM